MPFVNNVYSFLFLPKDTVKERHGALILSWVRTVVDMWKGGYTWRYEWKEEKKPKELR